MFCRPAGDVCVVCPPLQGSEDLFSVEPLPAFSEPHAAASGAAYGQRSEAAGSHRLGAADRREEARGDADDEEIGSTGDPEVSRTTRLGDCATSN